MERDGGEEWKLRRGDKIWWRREGDGERKEGRKELENMWEGGRERGKGGERLGALYGNRESLWISLHRHPS